MSCSICRFPRQCLSFPCVYLRDDGRRQTRGDNETWVWTGRTGHFSGHPSPPARKLWGRRRQHSTVCCLPLTPSWELQFLAPSRSRRHKLHKDVTAVTFVGCSECGILVVSSACTVSHETRCEAMRRTLCFNQMFSK